MAGTTVHPHANQVKVASGLEVLAAIWLFISAFAVLMRVGIAWSNAITAIVVGILALIRTAGAYGQGWLSWVNAALGAWVLLSEWIIAGSAATSGVIVNNVITGGVILVLGFWSAMATATERSEELPEESAGPRESTGTR